MSTVKDDAWSAQFQEIWTEVLGVDSVNEHDDFFELGGHSLSALRLSTLLRLELEVDLDSKDVLEHPRYGDLLAVAARAGHYVVPADYHIIAPPAPERVPGAGAKDRS